MDTHWWLLADKADGWATADAGFVWRKIQEYAWSVAQVCCWSDHTSLTDLLWHVIAQLPNYFPDVPDSRTSTAYEQAESSTTFFSVWSIQCGYDIVSIIRVEMATVCVMWCEEDKATLPYRFGFYDKTVVVVSYMLLKHVLLGTFALFCAAVGNWRPSLCIGLAVLCLFLLRNRFLALVLPNLNRSG